MHTTKITITKKHALQLDIDELNWEIHSLILPKSAVAVLTNKTKVNAEIMLHTLLL